MAFDYSKLKGRITEKYGTQERFAKEYGVTKQSISMKMNNKRRFTSDEIIGISKMLEIKKEEIGEYFFTKKV